MSKTSEFFCRATFMPVDPTGKTGLRAGYDCRCSGCMASLLQPMDPAVLREMQRQARGDA